MWVSLEYRLIPLRPGAFTTSDRGGSEQLELSGEGFHPFFYPLPAIWYACWHDELGPCSWVHPDLCSHCFQIAAGEIAREDVEQPADRAAMMG